jgi:ABC-type nitrate/sulfonate/bicarbonate transport system ATPase subunit
MEARVQVRVRVMEVQVGQLVVMVEEVGRGKVKGLQVVAGGRVMEEGKVRVERHQEVVMGMGREGHQVV